MRFVEALGELGLSDQINRGNIDSNDRIGRTPILFFAISKGWILGVRSLLAHGADPSARNIHGQTALCVASQRALALNSLELDFDEEEFGKATAIVELLKAAGQRPNRAS